MTFAVTAIDQVRIDAPGELARMYYLSPFVWRQSDRYDLLLRVVPRSDVAAEKIARVHYGRSEDGLCFTLEEQPVIAPGPAAEDRDGCEDPTLAQLSGTYYVYYTGWNDTKNRGNLMLAAGDDPRHLRKRGVSLPWSREHENPKEATLAQAADGTWRLFFEYAHDNLSKIGMASAEKIDGPWKIERPLFRARDGRWDCWHLSTGPVLCLGDRQVMFYNGASQNAQWRIGWIVFDALFNRVAQRCEGPLLAAPPERLGDATDIAFAASAISEHGGVSLYYSISDKDMFRATLREVPD